MAIDRTGISSLDTGASDITYTGEQGPKSPDQQLMASADPMLVEEYEKYVFEMEEQGMQPMSFKEFVQQIMSGMADGGIARIGLFRGALADTRRGIAMSPGTSADYSPGQGHRETRESRGGPPGITTAPIHIPTVAPDIPDRDGFERTDGGRYSTDTRELIAAKKKRDYFASLLGDDDETDEDNISNLYADISLPSGLTTYKQFKEMTHPDAYPELKDPFIKEGLTTPEQQEEFFEKYGPDLKIQGGKYLRGSPTITSETMMKDKLIPDTRNWFKKMFFNEGGIARLGYQRGQLVQPGPGRPGYQGRWSDPGMSPGTSRETGGGRGGPPGGGSPQMTYTAPPVSYQPPTRSPQESEAAEAVVRQAQAQAAEVAAQRAAQAKIESIPRLTAEQAANMENIIAIPPEKEVVRTPHDQSIAYYQRQRYRNIWK